MSFPRASAEAIISEVMRGRPWASGARVNAERTIDGVLCVMVTNGKFGRAIRCAGFTISNAEMLALSFMDLWGHIASELEGCLAKLGYAPVKRTTRWRVDRNGRRQWQVGFAMKDRG